MIKDQVYYKFSKILGIFAENILINIYTRAESPVFSNLYNTVPRKKKKSLTKILSINTK